MASSCDTLDGNFGGTTESTDIGSKKRKYLQNVGLLNKGLHKPLLCRLHVQQRHQPSSNVNRAYRGPTRPTSQEGQGGSAGDNRSFT